MKNKRKDCFKSKVAIITGGGSGIGEALCTALIQREAIVYVADVDYDNAESVASHNSTATAVKVDVSDSKQVSALIENVVATHGRLDYMFNNAGISILGECRDLSLDHYRSLFDVNLLGVLYGTHGAYAVMVKQGFGHIINISSGAGLIGYATNTPYATAKFGVIGLSTSLRYEAEALGVKVSVVCPGLIKTRIWDNATVVHTVDGKRYIPKDLKLIDATVAAEQILKGVEKNKSIIVFPFTAKLIWWLHRLHPSLTAFVQRRAVKEFRKTRIKE
jgi:NAD(P)-dependent dehydrogenase (short-subunit alcohol dehydrogenase family)